MKTQRLLQTCFFNSTASDLENLHDHDADVLKFAVFSRQQQHESLLNKTRIHSFQLPVKTSQEVRYNETDISEDKRFAKRSPKSQLSQIMKACHGHDMVRST